jgi:hypothetical protein
MIVIRTIISLWNCLVLNVRVRRAGLNVKPYKFNFLEGRK